MVRIDVDKFWRDGYIVVKNVFPRERIEALRETAYSVLEQDRRRGITMTLKNVTYIYGDLLSKEGLRDLVLDDQVIDIARQILGAEPVYFGNSSFQIGGESKHWLSWHKDNRTSDRENRRGDDWSGQYPVIRMAVYFQDHTRHSGGLAVRAGSHRQPNVNRGKPVIVPAEPGDLVVWVLTTTHSGNALRLKHFGDRAVGGRWVRLTPRRWWAKAERERVAAFMTFARESAHLDRYIEYIKTVRSHDELEWWRHSRFGEDVWEKARERGLKVLRVIPEYGTPLPASEVQPALS